MKPLPSPWTWVTHFSVDGQLIDSNVFGSQCIHASLPARTRWCRHTLRPVTRQRHCFPSYWHCGAVSSAKSVLPITTCDATASLCLSNGSTARTDQNCPCNAKYVSLLAHSPLANRQRAIIDLVVGFIYLPERTHEFAGN